MPEIGGIELQDLLAARGCSIPMVLITAFPSETVQARAMKGGAVGFLRKPFDGKELIACLDEAIKMRGSKTAEK